MTRPLRPLVTLLVAAASIGVALDVVLWLLGYDPAFLQVLLLALVLGSVLALVLETRSEAPTWESRYDRPPLPLGHDPRTSTNLRLLDDNRTSRAPGPALRDRLGALTDLTLHARRGLTRDDPRADALIGPTLSGVLGGAPRRLSPAEIDACLKEIEDL